MSTQDYINIVDFKNAGINQEVADVWSDEHIYKDDAYECLEHREDVDQFIWLLIVPR